MKQRTFSIALLLLGGFLCVFNTSQAQAGYTINGDIKGFTDSSIYLYRPVADSFKMDSASVTNGKFIFKGSVDGPTAATIINKDRNKGFRLYLENSKITISGNADSLQNVNITGSASQDDLNALHDVTKGIEKQELTIYGKYQEAKDKNDSPAQKVAENQIDSLNKLVEQSTKDFIKAHPKSIVGLDQLSGIAYSSTYPEMNKLFTGLDASLKNSKNGKKVAETLAIMEKTQNGKPAMPFVQNDVNGKPINLSDFKGKYVLIDFWASWCGPCRAENPNVLKAYNKYKNKNFTVLGISLDEGADKWKEAIAKDSLTWTEVSDLKAWKNDVAIQYGVQAIPTNFLIDPQGIIIGHNLRGDDLENKLEEVLNKK